MVAELHTLFTEVDGTLIRKVDKGKAKAGQVAGGLGPTGYLRVRVNGVYHSVHRVVWAMTYGQWPDHDIDHIDGNPLNNKPSNLRKSTQALNMRNTARRSDNTSGVKGVSWNKQRGMWRARIEVAGKEWNKFTPDLTEATTWLNRIRGEVHGEFACNGR